MKLISLILLLTATTTIGAPKVQIYKSGCELNKASKHHDRVEPYTSIRTPSLKSHYGTRPYVTMSILIKEGKTEALKTRHYFYNWESTAWIINPTPEAAAEQSTAQPACDYKNIKKITLRSENQSSIPFNMLVQKKSKIIATKTRIYIAGQLTDENETKDRACTWSDWEHI